MRCLFRLPWTTIERILEIEVFDVEPGEFAPAQATTVEHRQEGRVAGAFRCRGGGAGLKQLPDLLVFCAPARALGRGAQDSPSGSMDFTPPQALEGPWKGLISGGRQQPPPVKQTRLAPTPYLAATSALRAMRTAGRTHSDEVGAVVATAE